MDSHHRPLPAEYEFTRVLGAGGFGEVVLARHIRLKRLAAIRQIDRRLLGDAEHVERFERESKLILRTQSRAVLRVYEVIRSENGDIQLVMEYVQGRRLSKVLEAGPIPALKAIVILTDVADALETADARGVVHGDLRPARIFVLPGGWAKVGDFGLNLLRADPDELPAYVAPEVADGSEPDVRSDAYSFAVLAFEMLTGTLPFGDTSAADRRPEDLDPAAAFPGFPAEAAAALRAGMANDPATRTLPADIVRELSAIPADSWPAVDAAKKPEAAKEPVPAKDAPAKKPPAAKSPAAKKTPAAKKAASKTPAAKKSTPAKKSAAKKSTPAKTAAAKTPIEPLTARAALAWRPNAAEDKKTVKMTRKRRLAILAVVIGVLAAAGLVVRSAVVNRGPFVVKALDLAITPASGKLGCPGGKFIFRGSIATNGSKGSVTIRWTHPDGTIDPPRTVAVDRGKHEVPVRLAFSISGAATYKGKATLQVLKPVTLSAAKSFTYSCSG